MGDFTAYYEALNKLELTTVPEWIFYPETQAIDRQYIPQENTSRELNLWEDSYIVACVGHRGAGKTTLASALAIQSKWLWTELRVISNFPIKWRIKDYRGKYVIHQSEPLDLVRMVNFDQDYQHALIILDECPAILNRMNAASNKNKILNLWIQQIRKNHNSLILCSQDFKLIDYEAQYQVDVGIFCKDASRRYPNSGVKRGGVVLMDLMDNSGQWTGYTFKERPKYYSRRLNAEYIWGTFDTYFQLDIIEQLWRLEIQRETVKIGANEDDGNNDYLGQVDMVMQSLRDTGEKVVKCSELYQVLGIANSQGKKRDLGIHLKDIGCGRVRVEGEADWYYQIAPVGD